jgi:hypothetical protein
MARIYHGRSAFESRRFPGAALYSFFTELKKARCSSRLLLSALTVRSAFTKDWTRCSVNT